MSKNKENMPNGQGRTHNSKKVLFFRQMKDVSKRWYQKENKQANCGDLQIYILSF